MVHTRSLNQKSMGILVVRLATHKSPLSATRTTSNFSKDTGNNHIYFYSHNMSFPPTIIQINLGANQTALTKLSIATTNTKPAQAQKKRNIAQKATLVLSVKHVTYTGINGVSDTQFLLHTV